MSVSFHSTTNKQLENNRKILKSLIDKPNIFYMMQSHKLITTDDFDTIQHLLNPAIKCYFKGCDLHVQSSIATGHSFGFCNQID